MNSFCLIAFSTESLSLSLSLSIRASLNFFLLCTLPCLCWLKQMIKVESKISPREKSIVHRVKEKKESMLIELNGNSHQFVRSKSICPLYNLQRFEQSWVVQNDEFFIILLDAFGIDSWSTDCLMCPVSFILISDVYTWHFMSVNSKRHRIEKNH